LIIQGHALTELKKIPSESIHCVITSPPYWGLRKYDIPDVIWDGKDECKHEWGNELKVIGNEYQNHLNPKKVLAIKHKNIRKK